MKAIQVTQSGGPDVLAAVDLPIPHCAESDVLVKVAAAGVNFIDVYQREGRYKITMPFVPGQEGAGSVVAVGAGIRDVSIGDRVAWCGIMGSYAEYLAARAERTVPIPAGVSEEQAAATVLQGITAHYLTHDTYHLGKGDTALVHAAAGGVGLLLLQMAHRLGARVIGTVSTPEKERMAREAGADEVIQYTQMDFASEVMRMTGGKGVDVVYDSVGRTTFDKGLNVLRPRGMMVLYGGSSGAVPPFDPMLLSQKGSLFLTRPTIAHYATGRAELLRRSNAVLTMVAAGELTINVGHRYPLSDAAQAHRDLEGRKSTGKLLLVP